MKSMRSSSVGQRWPSASTTSTSTSATSWPSACAAAGTDNWRQFNLRSAVRRFQFVLANFVTVVFRPTAFSVPGCQAMVGKCEDESVVGLSVLASDLAVQAIAQRRWCWRLRKRSSLCPPDRSSVQEYECQAADSASPGGQSKFPSAAAPRRPCRSPGTSLDCCRPSALESEK